MSAEATWIWSRNRDLGVFGGSFAVALALFIASPWLSPQGAVAPWAFLVFIIAIDVAHVHATLFRTYLDRRELARRPALYTLVPVAGFAVGVLLHVLSPALFWSCLAYVAVFHFIRQQAGWVAIYRAHGGERRPAVRKLDNAVIYLGTGWPLLYWHVHDRPFSWFVPGDFLTSDALAWLLWPVLATYVAALATYAWLAVSDARRGATVPWGKHLVVGSTCAIWFVGIVVAGSDFEFTVANVIVHGVPYLALLWAYTRHRAAELPGRSFLGWAAKAGISLFLGSLLVLAFAEEMLWDRFVWHDHPMLFGESDGALSVLALSLIVPLLALPQITHYVLDAVLWRRQDTGPAQAKALGFGA